MHGAMCPILGNNHPQTYNPLLALHTRSSLPSLHALRVAPFPAVTYGVPAPPPEPQGGGSSSNVVKIVVPIVSVVGALAIAGIGTAWYVHRKRKAQAGAERQAARQERAASRSASGRRPYSQPSSFATSSALQSNPLPQPHPQQPAAPKVGFVPREDRAYVPPGQQLPYPQPSAAPNATSSLGSTPIQRVDL